MDVISASLNYLAVHICHESNRAGIIGKCVSNSGGIIATTFAKGDDECDCVNAELKAAIEEFNFSLSNFGHDVGFRAYEVLKGIKSIL